MAVPFEIQIGRVARFFSKWASTKGSSPRITIGSDITPVLPLWSGVENRFLDSWNRFCQATLIAAVAAQFNQVQLRNPAGSNVIAVLESIVCENTTADQPTLSGSAVNTSDLATTVPTNSNQLDPRAGVAIGSTLILSKGSAAASPQFTNIYKVGGFGTSNGSYEFVLYENQEIPLLPGWTWRVNSNVVNQSLNCSIMWRERSLEESERQ